MCCLLYVEVYACLICVVLVFVLWFAVQVSYLLYMLCSANDVVSTRSKILLMFFGRKVRIGTPSRLVSLLAISGVHGEFSSGCL